MDRLCVLYVRTSFGEVRIGGGAAYRAAAVCPHCKQVYPREQLHRCRNAARAFERKLHYYRVYQAAKQADHLHAAEI